MLVGQARLEPSSSLADAVAKQGCSELFLWGFVPFRTHTTALMGPRPLYTGMPTPRNLEGINFHKICMLAPLRNRRHCVARGGSCDDISVTLFSRMTFTKNC